MLGPTGADLRAPPGGEAEEAAEADPREQVGGGHADVGGAGGQAPFGGADVRPAAQQLAGIADRQGLGDRRQVARRKVHCQLFRPLAEEGGDTVPGALGFRLQLRHAGGGGRQARIGAQYVEFGTDPGVAQLLGELARLLLVLQVAQGNLLAQLRAAQLAVGVHQLGDQADLQLLQVGLGRFAEGVAGLQLTADAPEQVKLPGAIQAKVVALAVDPVLGHSRLLALADVGAGAAGDHREAIIGHVVAQGAGGAQAGERHAQVAVAAQRLFDQLVQGRIVELFPPQAFEAAAVVGLARRGVDLRRRGVGGPVVRTHRAGAERQQTEQTQGGREPAPDRLRVNHACTSGRPLSLAARRASRFSTKRRMRT